MIQVAGGEVHGRATGLMRPGRGRRARATAKGDHNGSDDSKVVRLFPEVTPDDLVPIGAFSGAAGLQRESENGGQAGAWSEDRTAQLLDASEVVGSPHTAHSAPRSRRFSARIAFLAFAGAALAAGALAVTFSARPHPQAGKKSVGQPTDAAGVGARSPRALAETAGRSRSAKATAPARHTTRTRVRRKPARRHAVTHRDQAKHVVPVSERATSSLPPAQTQHTATAPPAQAPTESQPAAVSGTSQSSGSGAGPSSAQQPAFGESGALGPGHSPAS
jgi:hypothetical protein